MAHLSLGIPSRKPQPKSKNSLAQQYKLADTAITQQAGDYDTIMGGYKDILNQFKNPLAGGTYNPQTYNYAPTADYTGAIRNLQDISQTGGYSAGDISDLRSRGVSPIRSVYANAQRDINRQRAISGSTGANYSALKARMAREMSDRIAQQVSDVNAGIAERVAQNKVGVAGQLAGITANEQSERNKYGMANTDILNQASMFNLKRGDERMGNQLQAVEGMRGLYGTTPALSALFGNQALNAAQLQNQINQQNMNNGLQIISKRMRGPIGGR